MVAGAWAAWLVAVSLAGADCGPVGTVDRVVEDAAGARVAVVEVVDEAGGISWADVPVVFLPAGAGSEVREGDRVRVCSAPEGGS